MKRTIILLSALFGLVFSAAAYEKGDARFTQKDVENFQEVMDLLAPDRELPMSELVIKVAKHFLGTPYVAGTLEIEPERLTINTRETDCILFVEMCLAMSLTAKDAEPTFEKYVDNLRRLRYRNGKVVRQYYDTWCNVGVQYYRNRSLFVTRRVPNAGISAVKYNGYTAGKYAVMLAVYQYKTGPKHCSDHTLGQKAKSITIESFRTKLAAHTAGAKPSKITYRANTKRNRGRYLK